MRLTIETPYEKSDGALSAGRKVINLRDRLRARFPGVELHIDIKTLNLYVTGDNEEELLAYALKIEGECRKLPEWKERAALD